MVRDGRVQSQPGPRQPDHRQHRRKRERELGRQRPGHGNRQRRNDLLHHATSNDNVDEPNGSVTATIQAGAGYAVGSPASAAVSVVDNDDAPEDPDPPVTDKPTKAQLIAQATALQSKYETLQHESLTHRGLYLKIQEVVKALNGEPSRLDIEWYAPGFMRDAINTANQLGDTQAAEVLAQARDFLGIKVLE